MEEEPQTYIWKEGAIKGSERFLDLLKAEQDRLTNKVRVAEDRARGNSTVAIAAVGVVTVLRTLDPQLAPGPVVLFVAGVLLVLGLMTAILSNRDSSSITSKWMREETTRLWEDGRPYMEIMQLYQRGWITNIEELHKLQDAKYRLLGWQNIALVGVLGTLVFILVFHGSALR